MALTDEQLEGFEALPVPGTPGPWESKGLGSEGYAVYGVVGTGLGGSPLRRPRVAFCGNEPWNVDKTNAAFIAAAPEMRDAITALVVEVRRLQEGQQWTKLVHDASCPYNFVKPEGPCTCGLEEWRHVIANALARLAVSGATTEADTSRVYEGVVAEIRRGLDETRRGMDV